MAPLRPRAAPSRAGAAHAGIEDPKRVEARLAGESRLLEMIARGKPLGETLDTLCRLVEQTVPAWQASIAMIDRNAGTIWIGAAPTLPKGYIAATDGSRIDPSYAPWGLAAQGQQVIASDIVADTRWSSEYRGLALHHGLRACWLTPIKSPSGELLGVFEIYLRKPGDPSTRPETAITPFVHLAGIAIEQARAMPGEVIEEMLNSVVRSEERFARAMDAAGHGHSEWNVDTGEFHVSPRLLEICGFPAGTTFRDREHWLRSFPIHPDDRAKWNAAIRGEADFTIEVRIVVHGETRWVEKRYLSQRNLSGRPVMWTGLTTDITDRKRASEAVRASEARFRSLTELSSDWYWEQDENLRFSYLSDQANYLTGYSGQSSIGKLRWEMANTMPLTCTWAEHQAVLAARLPFRELEMARVAPDGTVWYLSINGSPLFDEGGRFKGYHGTGRNITERKRIEEELRSRQEMLDLAQKSAGAVPWEWRYDIGGPAENRWSRDLAALFGVPEPSFGGSQSAWRELIHPDDRPAVEAALEKARESGEVDLEYRVLHPDAICWLQQKGRMFIGADGNPERAIGFMFDVSQRHKSEEELARLEKQLRLAQRLESMGTLAGGIAHDFNNILGAILGYGEMALRDAPKASRLRRDLTSIMTAGERGRALIDRVLAFSRSGLGEHVAVHVQKVVSEAIELIAAKLPEGIHVQTHFHAGHAAILGDATQVHQVLMNLGTNAVQAMPSGGTLSFSLEAVRSEARTTTIGNVRAGDYVVLTVADTGSGIPREIVDRIFDPFFTTKEVGTGTGLGLSLVHGIVAELGGAIDVVSTSGQGSEFTVYFPRSGDAEDSAAVAETEGAPLPRGDGQRVMIVDDEAPLCKVAARALEDLSYAPTTFTSSTAALAAFRKNPERYDALITDERMPRMSGIAMIKEVRGLRSTLPILLVTGYLDPDVVRRAREAGADEVLKKPLSARDLATSLARVLRR